VQTTLKHKKNLLVFALGNPARGDDALGPLLAKTIQWGYGVKLIVDYQLQLEHALELKNRELALCIDAATNIPAPFSFYPVAPDPALAHTTHALPPPALLQVAVNIGITPPPCFVLGVAGESFTLGEGLSEAAKDNLQQARRFLDKLQLRPYPNAWLQYSDAPLPPLPLTGTTDPYPNAWLQYSDALSASGKAEKANKTKKAKKAEAVG